METFESFTRDFLSKNGIFESQLDEIMDLIKKAPETEPMIGRWSEGTHGCPPMVQHIVTYLAKPIVLKWIDNNCPNAWFRPVFTERDDD